MTQPQPTRAGCAVPALASILTPALVRIVAPTPTRLSTPALALLALAPLPHTTTLAQEVTVLTEDLCAACSIETTPDALLGADGESVIGIAWDIQRLSDGRFTMAFQDVIYEFTIFSPDGSEFQRVGREGEGPGEYRFVFWVREHADQLHVFDWKRRQITVLDDGLEAVRTLPVRCLDCNGVDMAILPDGAVALNYFLAAADAGQPASANEGFAVHIIEADGEPRLSLDGIPMKDRFNPVEDADRHLQVAPDGSLLVAHRRRYRIDRRDPATGELLQTFVREADWIRDSGGNWEPPSPDRPPATTISAMHMDEAGRLWVNVSRPAPDWRDRVVRTGPDAHPEEGQYRYGPGSTERVMEVVDLESGRVLVSQVLDSEALGWWFFFTSGWLASYSEDGYPQYRMWRMRLEGLE